MATLIHPSHQLAPVAPRARAGEPAVATYPATVVARCTACGGQAVHREAPEGGGALMAGHDVWLEQPCGAPRVDAAVPVQLKGLRLMSFWPAGSMAVAFTTLGGGAAMLKIPHGSELGPDHGGGRPEAPTTPATPA